jgi:spore coat polysaccharide biosynthesis predicted glycosyltransferase SpsG
MPALMPAADVAVSAGGITMFELCCLGVPGIIVCAERFEVQTAARLDREGAVINLGFGADLEAPRLVRALNMLINDPVRRQSMSATGRRLIDGRGAERIVALLRSRTTHRETKVQ